MPLTAILRSGDLDQQTTHARLAVGRPAVTVPEDLAGSSRYRPPPRRPASRMAALPARHGPPEVPECGLRPYDSANDRSGNRGIAPFG